MTPNREVLSPAYGQWVAELKNRYRAAQIKAAVAVNRELLRFYWDLGRDIVVRFEKEAGYGTGFFDRLSADLARAIPEARGFSPVNLRYCRRFWRLYAGAENLPQVVEESSGENLQQLVEELAGVPWGHLAQHRRTRSRPFRWGPMGTKEVLATKNAKDAKGTRKRENSGREAGVVSEERTVNGAGDGSRWQSKAIDGSRRMLGRCLNELCDDWESVASVCAGLGIGAADAAGAGAVGDCLRRAVAEGLAEAFDFREGAGFVRHVGGLENMEKLWFFITERGREALEEMPEEWFAGAGAEGDGSVWI